MATELIPQLIVENLSFFYELIQTYFQLNNFCILIVTARDGWMQKQIYLSIKRGYRCQEQVASIVDKSYKVINYCEY